MAIDETAESIPPFLWQLDVQMLINLIQRRPCIEQIFVFPHHLDGRLLGIVFVLDLTDDLLQQILDRHDAGRAAILIHHDRHVHVALLHLLQQLVHLLRLRDEIGIAQDTVERHIRAAIAQIAQQILGIQDTDDVVYRAFIDRNAGMPVLQDHIQSCKHRRVGRHGCHINARHHHLTHQLVAEGKDRGDQLLLIFFDGGTLLRGLNQEAQALFGEEHMVADGARRGYGPADALQRHSKGPQDQR